jgi:hypothetical protein
MTQSTVKEADSRQVDLRDKRSEPRLFIDEPAMLHILRPSVSDRIAVRILDMSQSGLGLRSSQPLPEGALVHVRIRGTLIAVGEVRYSAAVDGEYYSGVRVEHAADCRDLWETD